MPALVDTTLRLLGQEPLAGRLPTSEQIRIGEILDQAGFSYLEVSGGGCLPSRALRYLPTPKLEPSSAGESRAPGSASGP